MISDITPPTVRECAEELDKALVVLVAVIESEANDEAVAHLKFILTLLLVTRGLWERDLPFAPLTAELMKKAGLPKGPKCPVH